jgi:hypothetical protein
VRSLLGMGVKWLLFVNFLLASTLVGIDAPSTSSRLYVN